MSEEVILYDPTSETTPSIRPRLKPPQSLGGKTVALLDLGKLRSDEFLDYLDVLLTERQVTVKRFAKPTNAKTAPVKVLQDIAANADVVIEALSD